jgi:hypothetical protein
MYNTLFYTIYGNVIYYYKFSIYFYSYRQQNDEKNNIRENHHKNKNL